MSVTTAVALLLGGVAIVGWATGRLLEGLVGLALLAPGDPYQSLRASCGRPP